ncbi:unnamed protein product, partial [Coregonus sp. 'balchen']
MNCAAILILTASCFSWTSAIYLPNRQATKKLKYLLEPPVYAEVTSPRGGSATLPCILRFKPSHYKVKWTKLEPLRCGSENIVMITNGYAHKPYGLLGPRASLRNAHAMDASLQLSNLELEDDGRYRCELINSIDDESVIITLRIEGMVFPYQSKNGRYKFTYQEAKEACAEQDGTLATFKQLYRGIQYSISKTLTVYSHGQRVWIGATRDGSSMGQSTTPSCTPRPECGGELLPGIRSYGPRDRIRDHFDAFCFTSRTTGQLNGFWCFVKLSNSNACRGEGAELALVGQLYSAWRFLSYDRCDGGWLKDGSVRFPITTPRERCGGIPGAGVRTFGYPNKTLRLYGAFCY